MSVPDEVRSITGLRWFAALAVYVYHFGYPEWIPNGFWRFQHNGLLGVQFFFVLSGYVLGLRYKKQVPKFAHYLRSRFARLAPMYLCGLLLSVIYLKQNNEPALPGLFLIHLFGLQSWSSNMDHAVAFNGPAWTVSVEVFFYLLFPLFVYGLQQRLSEMGRGLVLICAGTGLGALLTLRQALAYGSFDRDITDIPNDFIWFPLVPIHYLGLFVTGIGASFLVQAIESSPARNLFLRLAKPSVVLSIIFAAAYSLTFNSPSHPYLALSARFWLTGPAFAILLMSLNLHRQAHIARLLGSTPVRYLGKLSYSFYIIHVPFISLLRLNIPNVSYETKFVALLVVSAVFFHSVEKPLQRLLTTSHTETVER